MQKFAKSYAEIKNSNMNFIQINKVKKKSRIKNK